MDTNELRTRIKRWLPRWIQSPAKAAYRKWTGLSVARYDHRRFTTQRFSRLGTAKTAHLDAKLIFHAHSLEKGLSHRVMRPQFGREALAALADTMHEYRSRDLETSRPAYVNAVSTLKAYVEAHERVSADVSHLDPIFGPLLHEVNEQVPDIGGVNNVTAVSKTANKSKNFRDLFNGRASVREFGAQPIDEARIRAAIALSTKSPSVCNRQASRVRHVSDRDLIQDVLKVQGGMNGYSAPPGLLIVTTDISQFLGPTERNQPFIDGGLFAMSLLLALEFEGIAACPLNAMFTAQREEKVRDLAGIPANERLLLFIAVGDFETEVNVPKSFRLAPEAISSAM